MSEVIPDETLKQEEPHSSGPHTRSRSRELHPPSFSRCNDFEAYVDADRPENRNLQGSHTRDRPDTSLSFPEGKSP